MKTANMLAAIAALVLITSPLAFGRLGETPAQCSERYGEVKFANTKGDLEYRFYRVNGKKVQVTFYKSLSVMERIVSEQRVLGSPRFKTQASSDFLSFVRGLLSSAYGFTDEQMSGLGKLQDNGRDRGNSDWADKGSVRAVWYFLFDYEQGTVKFSALVMNTDGVDDRVNAFQTENIFLEGKSREREKAEGF